jgi:HSP20 family molecular chaperone IbpA
MAELTKQEPRGSLATAERTRGGLTFLPRVDIVENDNELLIFADMAGVKAEDLDIRFENGELSIFGRVALRHENVDFTYGEYGIGDFFRTFLISEAIDAEKISAELKNGVLKLHLPKSEAAKPKRITVQAS